MLESMVKDRCQKGWVRQMLERMARDRCHKGWLKTDVRKDG